MAQPRLAAHKPWVLTTQVPNPEHVHLGRLPGQPVGLGQGLPIQARVDALEIS
jgi:hypothetical protein